MGKLEFKERHMRNLLFLACAAALTLALSGCDRCGDPVKINFPGVNACSESR
ncbi:MAG: hypothetical protein U1E28_01480 [Beijerinckiaceae bacterium]